MTGSRPNYDAQSSALRKTASRRFDFVAAREALRRRAEIRSSNERHAFARAAAAATVSHFWSVVGAGRAMQLPMRPSPIPSVEVSDGTFAEYGASCGELELADAFYQIGELYTCLLPSEYRTRNGIFYTPPRIVGRLLDLLEIEGIDWATARVLDPACGGAAFAAYIAQRMLATNAHLPPEERLRDLSQRLVGIDIDPFATWLAEVFLEAVCLPLLTTTRQRLDGIIRLGDTLSMSSAELGGFDAVIGNPPYGKVTLNAKQRARFERSLFGHANLYGVFTDLAVSVTNSGGLIGLVTPTSFLGGEYFKHLRQLLLTQTQPVRASFIADREGVFSGVLQETMLTVMRKDRRTSNRARTAARLSVESIHPEAQPSGRLDPLGSVPISTALGAPWVLPRSKQQLALIRHLARMPSRLADYGYRVATGQLVWNRHKPQFRDRPLANCYPVLWAECIQPDGTFIFRSQNRNHQPYLFVPGTQEFLLNREPCILLQRTTSKEQSRRLVAALIPNSFVLEYPGYVVENHVNMLLRCASSAVPMWAVTQLMNSGTVDQAFRCISGSVAVSAYEVENLPLPDPVELMKRVRKPRGAIGVQQFEDAVRELYFDV